MPRRKKNEEPEATGVGLADAILRQIEEDDPEEVVGAPKDFIAVPSLAFEIALNMPGIPVGRLTVLRGWEQSGKSTLAMHLLIETQRRGGVAVYLDSENTYDEYRSQKMGLVISGPDRIIVRQPQTVEQAITYIEKFIAAARAEVPDALVTIVWDSVAGTSTDAELEGEFGGSRAAGHHAKLLRRAMRRITKTIAQEQIALIIVNQNSDKIDMGAFSAMRGNSGPAMIADHPLSFHASVVIDMTKGSELKKDKDSPAYGVMSRFKVSKNKCSHPFGKGESRLLFDTGYDADNGFFQAALKLGMIAKKGTGGRYRLPDAEESFYESQFGGILDGTPGLREKIADAARRELWPRSAQDKYLDGEEPQSSDDEGGAASADD